MANVLVLGGAGYVGSHVMKQLAREGHRAIALDNLSSGHRDSVLYGELVVADISDTVLLESIMMEERIDIVMHLAAQIEASQSVISPASFYRNNLSNTIGVLETMLRCDLKKIIFSSTAAVYGDKGSVSLTEEDWPSPKNPYGRSKLMVEEILDDYRSAYEFASISFRYFNAAGADPDRELGERHYPETHIIPLVIQTALGLRERFTVFGSDYPTRDGTCERDFVHVTDIARAHILGMERLLSGDLGSVYNLGNENGFSVLEVLDMVRQISKTEFSVSYADRRAGDSARLVANSSLVRAELGWVPQFSDLKSIVSTALDFYVASR